MDDQCPFHVGPIEDEETFKIAGTMFDIPVDELITQDIGKWRNQFEEVQECFGDIHNQIRKNVSLAHHRSALNIYPLIVASEIGNPSDPLNRGRQGVGGTYTLYRTAKEIYRMTPVHPVYEILKVVNHLILGVFVIVEPYLDLTVNQRGVQRARFFGELKSYKQKLEVALSTVRSMTKPEDVNELFLSPKTKELVEHVLAISIEYIESVERTKRVRREEFLVYSDRIRPTIRDGMRIATEQQAKGVISMLLKWKSMLTEEEWKNMYLVIPTVWVTSANNPREQLFRLMMDKENQDTHIIIGENLKDQYAARKLVGRVVHDRMMARFIFGTKDTWSQRKCQGLGSRSDSLMDYIRQNIVDYVENWKKERKQGASKL